MKEGSRVESQRHSLREIANLLGYDEGQLSRILNPPIGKNKSDDTYKRLCIRISQIKQISDVADTLKWYKWIVATTTLLAVLFALLWLLPSQNKPVEASGNLLTITEMEAVINLHNDYVMSSLIAEGLLFNGAIKEGVYQEMELERQLNNLRERIQNTITKGRKNLKKARLYTPNGYELSVLLARFNKNDIEDNLMEIRTFLVNSQIPASVLEKEITRKMINIQNKNIMVFDSVATLATPPL